MQLLDGLAGGSRYDAMTPRLSSDPPRFDVMISPNRFQRPETHAGSERALENFSKLKIWLTSQMI